MKKTCDHPREHREIGVVIARNGSRMVRQRCLKCGEVGKHTHPHAAHPLRNSYPVFIDHQAVAPECDRCGSKDGVETHHWAPYHLFDDAHLWPTADLCVECHQTWHAVVTPEMNRKRQTTKTRGDQQ
jgi:transposase